MVHANKYSHAFPALALAEAYRNLLAVRVFFFFPDSHPVPTASMPVPFLGLFRFVLSGS